MILTFLLNGKEVHHEQLKEVVNQFAEQNRIFFDDFFINDDPKVIELVNLLNEGHISQVKTFLGELKGEDAARIMCEALTHRENKVQATSLAKML